MYVMYVIIMMCVVCVVANMMSIYGAIFMNSALWSSCFVLCMYAEYGTDDDDDDEELTMMIDNMVH